MKNFKQWPYWVRGGIVTLIIFFLPMVLLRQYFSWEIQGGSWQFELYIFLNKIPLLLGANKFGNIISGFIGYLAVGAILGWLYGKIKNRKIKDR